jgi:predicted transcriptional regulator
MKAEFTTRLDGALRRRLRVFAAVSERTIEDIVGSALDGYLPPGPELSTVAAAPALAEQSAGCRVTAGATPPR